LGDNISEDDSLGMLGMTERAYQYGGNIVFENYNDGGTQLTVCIPVNRKAQEVASV